MKDELSQIKNYIDEIGTSRSFEYDFCLFLQNILDTFTAKQQDEFIKEVFKSEDPYLYFIAGFLDFKHYNLKGKYEYSYVFCECFSKIDTVDYLAHLYNSLELHLMRRKLLKDDLILSLEDIVNNLYLLINHLKDENSINFCLKIIENLDH